LAAHYIARGDFTNALTKYLDAKDAQHDTLDTCLQIIRASIYIGSMSDVTNQAARARSIHTQQLRDSPVKSAMINASVGLHALKGGMYRAAAGAFLSTTFEIDGRYTDVLSARDVAVYGCITALATYDRPMLHDEVLHNAGFKSFLELVPIWRKIVSDYQASKYTDCFKALERVKNDMLLDIYLSSHVNKLIGKILDRALDQYFRPFTSVRLQSMADAFGMEVPRLESQLSHLIADGRVLARIDSHSKVLHARHGDARSTTFEKAMEVGNRYVRDCKALLMRLSLVENDFVVRQTERRMRRDRDEPEGKEKAH